MTENRTSVMKAIKLRPALTTWLTIVIMLFTVIGGVWTAANAVDDVFARKADVVILAQSVGELHLSVIQDKIHFYLAKSNLRPLERAELARLQAKAQRILRELVK